MQQLDSPRNRNDLRARALRSAGDRQSISCTPDGVARASHAWCARVAEPHIEVGNQVLTLSHRKLLSSKAMVNVAETPGPIPIPIRIIVSVVVIVVIRVVAVAVSEEVVPEVVIAIMKSTAAETTIAIVKSTTIVESAGHATMETATAHATSVETAAAHAASVETATATTKAATAHAATAAVATTATTASATATSQRHRWRSQANRCNGQ